jgi:hypothetical protein
MDKEQCLRELLTLFLQINCEPSDDQFHALAHALGVDKESLEATAYEMLGDEIEHEHEEGDDQELHELVEGAPKKGVSQEKGIPRGRAGMPKPMTKKQLDDLNKSGVKTKKPGSGRHDKWLRMQKGSNLGPEQVEGATKKVRDLKKQLQDLEDERTKILMKTGKPGLAEVKKKIREVEDALDAEEAKAYKVKSVSTHFPEGEEVEDFGVVNAVLRLTLTAGLDDEYGEEGLSEQQEVLQGEEDPSTTPADDMDLTDGAPVGQSTDDEIQDSQLVDGVGEDDTGIGFESDKSMLLNDGAPALQLKNASSQRLATTDKGIPRGRAGMPKPMTKKQLDDLKKSGVKLTTPKTGRGQDKWLRMQKNRTD